MKIGRLVKMANRKPLSERSDKSRRWYFSNHCLYRGESPREIREALERDDDLNKLENIDFLDDASIPKPDYETFPRLDLPDSGDYDWFADEDDFNISI